MTENPLRKKYWEWRVVLVLGIIVALVTPIYFSGHIGPVDNPRARALEYATQLQSAILNYDTEYGVMPSDTNNAALIRTLMGGVTPTGHPIVARGNPRGIPFFSAQMQYFNDKGELIDPWGTPYYISIEAKSAIHVRSAGPDKIFGTPDDITNQ